MSDLGSFVKRLRDIMRNDAGINGDAQRIEQIAWMLFLKVYDSQEENWEFDNEDYKSIIPEELRWRNWAVDDGKGTALTGDKLLDFVNNTLFPVLQGKDIKDSNGRTILNGIVVDANTPINKAIVQTTFEDANQYMKDGVLLRQVLNIIDGVDFGDYEESHAFGDIYESILKELQSAGSAGEFYTPRAVTDFMAEMIKPQIGESMADFACGTGGFLVSWIKQLQSKVANTDDAEALGRSIYGIEKKQFPYMLCVTNMLLHGVDVPRVYHDNSLLKDVLDYTEKDQFDVILMNPPYGGSEKNEVKNHFPEDIASRETADLFMSVIMYRMKENGRAAVVLPDLFLSGTEGTKYNIKRKLCSEFNLHTIIRLPGSVFSPYTDIPTNILFFDKGKPTKETWIYRVDLPENYKHFSKTKPLLKEHFRDVISWWDNRTVITDDENESFKARKYTIEEIISFKYNLDLCGYPKVAEEILSPVDTINQYISQREQLDAKLLVATNALEDFIAGDHDVQIFNIKKVSDEIVFLDSNFNNKMRSSILSAAVRGQLTQQLESDGKCQDILKGKGINTSPVDVDDDNYYDIPDSWSWMHLEELCLYLQRGKSPSYSTKKVIPVVSQKCVQWSGFSLELAKYIDPDSLENYAKERLLKEGDILINSTGLGTVGRAAIYSSESHEFDTVVADSHVTVARLRSDLILPKYFYAYWANPSVQTIIESQTSGSTKQKELSLKTLKKYLIPVPPLAEQERIIDQLDLLLPAFE